MAIDAKTDKPLFSFCFLAHPDQCRSVPLYGLALSPRERNTPINKGFLKGISKIWGLIWGLKFTPSQRRASNKNPRAELSERGPLSPSSWAVSVCKALF